MKSESKCYLRPSLRNGLGSIAHEVFEVGATVVRMNKLEHLPPTERVFMTGQYSKAREKFSCLICYSTHKDRISVPRQPVGRITMKGFRKFQIF